MGIFFIIWCLGFFFNVIDLGDLNTFILVLFLAIAAGLSILSGFFHLEKS
jgi:hypothetical protein